MCPPKGQTNNIQFKLNLTSLTFKKKKKKLSWTKLKTIRSSIQCWIPSEAHTNEILLGGLAAPEARWTAGFTDRHPCCWGKIPGNVLISKRCWWSARTHARTRQKRRDSSLRFEIMNLKYLFLATLFSFSFPPSPFREKKTVELTLNSDPEMRTPPERKTNSSSNLRLCSTLIINQ